ncbi:hypothetical protein BDQ17DRAFT_1265719 [Cyathus striatus]|nr:hypothetical protein BDQ17DRAFT_1265719 [Cyathus striatus]
MQSKSVSTFCIWLCLWQCKVVQAVLKQDCNVISINGTGLRKMLTFWMPLLFHPADHIQINVTPLNILGKQHVESLAKAGMKGIFIGRDTATAANFQVSIVFCMQVWA